ncbi:hypothetical protein CKM354_000784100 [Cercospora kikuchii]|uniref:Cytochrome P450 n=1 Tax=Cercospora kikuchii TaxID=84275 RepID=A0A9P3CRX2_9PEZI|nr:uncharacterized protein CKM354_000784100 [Cercospora kikuchii]GIZ44650.1 hypothetical protein CKM354_000784100 [Cercospora kikuchii]
MAQARSQQFLDDFELVNLYLIKRIRYQMLYWLADDWHFRRATSRLHAFTEHFVQKAIAQRQGEDHHAECGLLSALAFGTPDRAQLRNQTMAILAAARDTTAGFLGWCFVRLALHQDIFHELRNAVRSTFGEPEHLDFDRLHRCAPLQRFLKEVLRLHPPVPVNNRRAKVDTQLPTGGGAHGDAPVAVRKGQVVIYSVYLMHRRVDLWGEDAVDFRPGRWVHDFPAWQYLPFSGGPRACLGQQFALAEASYVVARLAMECDAIRPVNTLYMSQLRKGLGLTMWPADGVPVRLHKA